MIGTHHASPMFARSAPCAIAIRRPSPVLFGGDTGAVHRAAQERLDQRLVPFEPAGAQHDAARGHEREYLCRPWRIRTPVMAPSVGDAAPRARASVCGVTPRSSRPFSSPAISAVPATQ